MSDFYTYVFVRRDLPVAQQIVQVGHACHEAGQLPPRGGPTSRPIDTPNIVLFEVANERELLQIVGKVQQQHILGFCFFEPDYDRGYTAFASQPIYRDNPLRGVFANYKLYDAPQAVPPELSAT